MSSDSNGAAGEAAATVSAASAASDSGTVGATAADLAQSADPWFGAGPKSDAQETASAGLAASGSDGLAARSDGDDHAAGAEDDHAGTRAEWFLRTGRAGLLPDAMTVAWDDDAASASRAHAGQEARTEAASAPPWAGEAADALASAPPPWETGPWPGPGGLRGAGSGGPGEDQQDGVETGWAAANGQAAANGGAIRHSAARDAAGGWSADSRSRSESGRWTARTVLTAGLVPLVVPGLVLGAVTLRQPAGPALRRASWLAIGASIAWAVVIIAIVAGISGGAAPTCARYPAAVHQAYEKVLADLSDRTSASVQAADLGAAASLANASAASAGQIGVRTALFAMANDMAEARADVVARRPVPQALRQHLIDDGAAPSGSCTS